MVARSRRHLIGNEKGTLKVEGGRALIVIEGEPLQPSALKASRDHVRAE